MGQLAEQLKQRTARFADDIVALCEELPDVPAVARDIKPQLRRAALAVGSGYSAVCRARSRPDFIAKMGKVVGECDECLFWLDRLVSARIATSEKVTRYREEANQLASIFVASDKTARTNARRTNRH
jgi:four helix bundle protein